VNLNGDIIRGLLLRRPDLDIVRAQDVGLSGAEDLALLLWAAGHDRILVTHDRATMPSFAYTRLLAGEPMPGVIIVNDRLAIRNVIEDLLLLEDASQEGEWAGQVIYLPL
jgi:hypothetical protein